MLVLLLQQLGQHLGVQLGLALRLYAATSLGPAEALLHAQAATAAATEQVSAELLIAVAFVESRFDPHWVSRVENGKRVYSKHPALTPPKRLTKGTSLYCGALQTRALSWEECLAQRDVRLAYLKGAAELASWLRDRRVRGDVTRALAGYGCGNNGVRTGKCNRYPGRVLWQARRFGGGFDNRRDRTAQARRRS
jgi:hypothetical protein